MHKRHVAHTALKPSRNRSLGPREATGLGGSATVSWPPRLGSLLRGRLVGGTGVTGRRTRMRDSTARKISVFAFLKTTTTTPSTYTLPSPVLVTPHNNSKCLADVCAPPPCVQSFPQPRLTANAHPPSPTPPALGRGDSRRRGRSRLYHQAGSRGCSEPLHMCVAPQSTSTVPCDIY